MASPDATSSAQPSFVFSVGPHCDDPELRQLARSLCVGLCSAGFSAVDISDNRVSSTSYTTALPTCCDSATLLGLSQADLRALSQRLKDRTEIFIPIVDLSMFSFEESLYVLYYGLRHACLAGTPVILPIVDASLIHVATALSRIWGGDVVEHVQQFPMTEAQKIFAECAARYIHGTFAEDAIRSVLPWLFQSSFFLTTDTSVGEMTSKLVNFATGLVEHNAGGDVDTALGESIADAYRRSFSKFSSKKLNSALSAILGKLTAEGAVACNALTVLDVTNCMLGDAGIQALAETLRKVPCVAKLVCRGNNIRDPGCHALSTHVSDHPSIVALDVSDNKITDAGVTSLYFMLEACSRIQEVVFVDNLNTSSVWSSRVQRMLERNRTLCKVLNGQSGSLPKKRAQCVCDTLTSVVGALDEKPSALFIKVQSTVDAAGSIDNVRVSCRFDGPAAEKASSIAGGVRSAQQSAQSTAKPSLELEFDLPAPSPSANSSSASVWNAERILQVAATSSSVFATSTMLLNLTRLNGQKLPVLFNAQRFDSLAVGERAASAPQQTISSWADVALALLTYSSEERRKYVSMPSSQEMSNWSPPPSYEVIMLLVMDIVVNGQKNIFSTAVRSLVKSNPVLRVDLRTVLDASANLEASRNSADSAAASLNGKSIGKPSTLVHESFFVETSFLVLLKLRGASTTERQLTTLMSRVNRPTHSGDVALHVVGASSSQYYRPRITRCAGNVSSEITALLRWMLRQTDSCDEQKLAHLQDGEHEDQRKIDHHESSLKVRITTKWAAGSGATQPRR